jgi:hypothetical protein
MVQPPLRAVGRAAVVVMSVALLALSYLALDDITTGNEPSFWAEYAMVLVTLAWFGALAAYVWRRGDGAQS